MAFTINEDKKIIQDTVSKLCEKVIAPIASDIDKAGEYPADVINQMADVNLFEILTPEVFGGFGGDTMDFAIATRELAKASASVATSYVESMCAANLILVFGTDEQKKKYIPDLAKGKKLAALAFTEPSGGANWSITLETVARSEGDHYVIKGSKCFISNGGLADIYIVGLRTNPQKGPMGMTAIIVEKGTPGFSFGKSEDKLGLRGYKNSELFFDDCKVPKANVLVCEGDVLPKMMPVYGALHAVGHSATLAGIANAALDAAIDYVKSRKVGKEITLAHFEGVQAKIADMAIKTETVNMLMYRTVNTLPVEHGPDFLLHMAPTFANELTLEITNMALTLHGGAGCTNDFPVERYFRDTKTLSFVTAVFDYQRLFVGKMLLNIPIGGPPPGSNA